MSSSETSTTVSATGTDRRVPVAAGLDTFFVVLFVAIGRREHERDSAIAGLIDTAAPFLIALALAWLVVRAWRRPFAWTTGLAVAVGTVAAGMVLRRVVFDDGTAASFVVVATVFLTATLVGWRLVHRTLRSRHLVSE
jgi:FlaA1/EpsC-like NDP-sugar epimerase